MIHFILEPAVNVTVAFSPLTHFAHGRDGSGNPQSSAVLFGVSYI